MSNKYFQNDEDTSQSTAPESENLMVRPPDEDPFPPDDPPYDPPYDSPPSNQSSPTGWLDSVDSSYASGWSYDPDNPSASNDVHIYIGGPAGSGAAGYGVTANQPRPDVNQAFGIGGDHGFSFQIPSQYADGEQYAVYAYGIDTGANSPSLLNGCPKYFVINPPTPSVSLNQVSPIAGAVAGGISITLTGSGFQPGAAVYFGNTPATQVTVESGEVIHVVVPATSSAGSVSVSVINPDGSNATKPGGFTYVTPADGQQAEVIGISPLAVIEDTTTVVTIRGRNLIEAYNTGLLALRGPSRCQITFLGTTTSYDAASGIDSVSMTVNIKCAPGLQPLERMAVQVLASRRAEAANDGVVESSKQMFTVLPKAIPVTLAYTSTLEPGKPNLVMVSGRNLDGCQLSLGNGEEVLLQKSTDNFISGIVQVPENFDASLPLQLSLENPGGVKVNDFDMTVATAVESYSATPGGNSAALASNGSDVQGEMALSFTEVPGQQFTGPTQNDSAVFSLNGAANFGGVFDFGNFEITILDITIVLPIINEVHLIPFFDGGGNPNSPILAEVGKIFRLRGAGVLVALRVEIRIHIQVVLIIGFYFDVWNGGLFNEFPQYSWAIGSVVLGIRIEIEILFLFSFLAAIVKPDGELYVIAYANLQIGIDILYNNGRLYFDPDFDYSYGVIGISPVTNNLQPCGGKFELLSRNGQTAFLDSLGGYESHYFVREAGKCCVPWDFNMRLSRFSSTGQEEIVQESFQTTYCVTAAESPVQYVVVITSDPPPTGVPPTLEMDIGDTATLKALALPVDATGNPTGEPAQDLRDLDYGVDFFLASPTNQVLNPTTLPPGEANAIIEGSNLIRAAVTSVRVLDEVPALAFWKDTVYGFREGSTPSEEPRLIVGGLPVTVNPAAVDVEVELSLAYKDAGKVMPVKDMYRDEPDAATPRDYFLAAKFKFPRNTPLPIKVQIKVESANMLVSDPLNTIPFPAGTFGSRFIRSSGTTLRQFFTGQLVQSGLIVEMTLNSLPNSANYVPFENATIVPNRVEVYGPAPRTKRKAILKYVPPGPKVTAHMLNNCKDTEHNAQKDSNCRRDVKVELKFSDLKITETSGNKQIAANLATSKIEPKIVNEETFEEYFRVFHEVRTLMSLRSKRGTPGSIGNFTSELIKGLSNSIAGTLQTNGKDFWSKARSFIKTGFATGEVDDRIVYFSRLEAMAALRDIQNRGLTALSDSQLNIFEYSSRGFETTDGVNVRVEFGSATNNVLVTGFDPFLLPDYDLISNSSGLIALYLEPENGYNIKTAVFPVRFRDFGSKPSELPGLVEKVMEKAVKDCGLILTCSWTEDSNFNIDRFAARYRTKTTHDNERILSASDDPLYINDKDTPVYIESTLPYVNNNVIKVILDPVTGTAGNRIVTGPQGVSNPSQDKVYLTLNQEYHLETQTSGCCVNRYAKVPNNQRSDPDSYERRGCTPKGCGSRLTWGSGGDYLSNEIFYRTSRIRRNNRALLPSGHLHVPTVALDPHEQKRGKNVITGGKEILELMLPYLLKEPVAVSVEFNDTEINTMSSKTINLSVPAYYPEDSIEISVIETTSSPFQVANILPVIINRGQSVSVTLNFSPTEAKEYTASMNFKNSDGAVVYTLELKGKGVSPTPPAPVITSFFPTRGPEGTAISIYGDNFTDATDVRVGGTSIGFYVVSPTEISADIDSNVYSGIVQVDTPSGTANSSTMFYKTTIRGGDPIEPEMPPQY